MSTAKSSDPWQGTEAQPIDRAVTLLSQQVWCWGRDILRREGNWLVESGFTRIEPPPEKKDSASLYVLELDHGRKVVLRGFGVFYCDPRCGGVFLPRFEFQPGYTPRTTLNHAIWSDEDLPPLSFPTDQRRTASMSLTLDLIDWIRSYEVATVERLGIEYRRATLHEWIDGKRPTVPAEEMASAWRLLGLEITEDYSEFQPLHHETLEIRDRD